MNKKILIYGLQRSGNNFLEQLIKRNFHIKVINNNKVRSRPEQRHFRLYDEKEIIPEKVYKNNLFFNSYMDFERSLNNKIPDGILIVSKDPYSWYLSYKNWGEKFNWPKVKHHYIEEYNLFYKKWDQFSKETNKILFVKYIDLLLNQEVELNKIEDFFSLDRKKYFLDKVLFKGRVSKVPQSERFTEEKFNYYKSKKYLEEIDKVSLNEINFKLDKKILSILGYDVFE